MSAMRICLCVACSLLLASVTGAQSVQQGSKLVATDTVGTSPHQGGAVAVSADGTTVIVGAPGDDGGRGAAWVFVRSGATWVQEGKLVGTGAVGSGAGQGEAVAISADGNTAIVGGPGDNEHLGAAWVFTRSGGVWAQQGEKLVGCGTVGSWINQGWAVALSADGSTALVGGPGYRSVGADGAAWVFVRSGERWTKQATLIGTGGAGPYAGQGDSVALSATGNTAVVGGSFDGEWMGALWVFTRTAGVWTQQGKKLVPEGMIGTVGPYEPTFSVATSADGDTIILGRPGDNGYSGAVWVFTRTDGTWTQVGAKLVASDAMGSSVALGSSVSLSADGDIALVGGHGDDDFAGATWVFARSGEVWTQEGHKLLGTGAVGNAMQGAAVAISADGSTAIVGGPGDNEHLGAAWVFRRPGRSIWVPVVAHVQGIDDSEWRSDLGLLNIGSESADVRLTFHGTEGLVSNTTYVPAGAQSLLVDVVAQLATSGLGALEIVSEQPLRVTSRTYNQAPPDASCNPSGTAGQSHPALTELDGLSESQSAWLPHLIETGRFRTNIGLLNTGLAPAEATVELYDGSGTLLTRYTVALAPGVWTQETQPFRNRAGQTAIQRGYAKVTVIAGAGVVALASVVDNITNDPTTITMQR